MFTWLPRWHPVIWAIVIILVIAVVSNPTGMGQRAGDMIHWLNYAAHQIVVFAESI
jgi:hypothetical protein